MFLAERRFRDEDGEFLANEPIEGSQGGKACGYDGNVGFDSGEDCSVDVVPLGSGKSGVKEVDKGNNAHM